jgi:hypothetical protein
VEDFLKDFAGVLVTDGAKAYDKLCFDSLAIEKASAIVRCLTDPRVPATHNHAERQVRPAVVTRKRGGCNRPERGARTFEVLTSLIVTARQRGTSLVDWMVALLRQPDPFAPAPFS